MKGMEIHNMQDLMMSKETRMEMFLYLILLIIEF